MWYELILSILWMAFFVFICMKFKGDVLRVVSLSVFMTAGFCFTAHFLCKRSNPFLSSENDFAALLEMLIFAELFGLLCCRETLSTLTKFKGYFKQEFFWYLVCFFLGLCTGYLLKIKEITFSLSARSLGELNIWMILLFSLSAVGAATLLVFSNMEAWKKEEFRWYFPVMLSFFSLFGLISYLIRDSYAPTVHRWFWSLFLIIFLRYPMNCLRLSQAFSLGSFVSALAMGGLERIWLPV